MKELSKYLAMVVTGFMLNSALHEVYDLVWWGEDGVCATLTSSSDEEFRCVYSKSVTLKVLGVVLWRPMLAVNARGEQE